MQQYSENQTKLIIVVVEKIHDRSKRGLRKEEVLVIYN